MEHPGEVWQELDFNGERIGGIKPSEFKVEETKLIYGAAVVLYRYKDREVEFLFQHRSKLLKGNPDKWDVSAGGHVNLDEELIEAAVRETAEEIGVKIDKDKLEFAAIYRRWIVVSGLYFYDWTGKPDEFKFNDEEVEEVTWIKYSELDEFWSKLKREVAEDKIFRCYLDEWNQKIIEKYRDNG